MTDEPLPLAPEWFRSLPASDPHPLELVLRTAHRQRTGDLRCIHFDMPTGDDPSTLALLKLRVVGAGGQYLQFVRVGNCRDQHARSHLCGRGGLFSDMYIPLGVAAHRRGRLRVAHLATQRCRSLARLLSAASHREVPEAEFRCSWFRSSEIGLGSRAQSALGDRARGGPDIQSDRAQALPSACLGSVWSDAETQPSSLLRTSSMEPRSCPIWCSARGPRMDDASGRCLWPSRSCPWGSA